MAYHAPDEETCDRAALYPLQRRKLAALLEQTLRSNSFYQHKLDAAGCRAFDPLTDPIERLPFTTRPEIEQDQLRHPPYGTNLAFPLSRYVRMHQTSGSTGGAPLRWLDTLESWAWCKHCWGIVFRAAGLRADDRVLFPFSFGPFLGFWLAFDSAAMLGNLCLPAGGMTTAARLRYLLDHRATVVCCTPTYALHLAEVAAHEGHDLANSSVRLLVVAGEPGGCIPATRARIESAWQARVIDHAGMTEIGAWGFEPQEAPGGLHVIESEFIAEAIDPHGNQPAAPGAIAELVLTGLGRVGSPLIRYRTGDLVRLTIPGCDTSAAIAGRWFARCEGGVLGRTDDLLTVRGNNVFPTALEGILRELPEVAEFRIEVETRAGLDELRIDIEPAIGAGGDLAERVVRRVRDRLHFRPLVRVLEPGALPRFELKASRVVKRALGGGHAPASGESQ